MRTMIDPFELLPQSAQQSPARPPAPTIDLEVDWDEDEGDPPGVPSETWLRARCWTSDDL
jgi:hypothetical protein